MVINMFGSIEQNSSRIGTEESSFGTPACLDMSVAAEELNWVKSSGFTFAE
jgi:hypothetical protein